MSGRKSAPGRLGGPDAGRGGPGCPPKRARKSEPPAATRPEGLGTVQELLGSAVDEWLDKPSQSMTPAGVAFETVKDIHARYLRNGGSTETSARMIGARVQASRHATAHGDGYLLHRRRSPRRDPPLLPPPSDVETEVREVREVARSADDVTADERTAQLHLAAVAEFLADTGAHAAYNNRNKPPANLAGRTVLKMLKRRFNAPGVLLLEATSRAGGAWGWRAPSGRRGVGEQVRELAPNVDAVRAARATVDARAAGLRATRQVATLQGLGAVNDEDVQDRTLATARAQKDRYDEQRKKALDPTQTGKRRKMSRDVLNEPLLVPDPRATAPSTTVKIISLRTRKARLAELRARADAELPEDFDDQARELERFIIPGSDGVIERLAVAEEPQTVQDTMPPRPPGALVDGYLAWAQELGT